MSRRLACFLGGSLLAVPVALFASPVTAWAGPLDAYLPKDNVIAGHVVTFEVAPEDQAISRQFRSAVRDNMDWFKKAVTSNAPGTPLPYDRRMGITEAQYQRLLHMKSDAKPGAAVKVEVKRAADGSVSFAPQGDAAAALKDVRFPADEKSAETPIGALSILNEIHQKDAAAPIGVWNGVEWARVAENDAKPSAKIAFGKRETDGSGVMYYQVSPYEGHNEQSVVVFYGLP